MAAGCFAASHQGTVVVQHTDPTAQLELAAKPLSELKGLNCIVGTPNVLLPVLLAELRSTQVAASDPKNAPVGYAPHHSLTALTPLSQLQTLF